MLDVNVLGAQRVASAALKQMVQQVKNGAATSARVLLISGTAARLGTAYNQHYAASKAALIAVARGIAVEFGHYNIIPNALLPGYVKTEMIGDLVENQKFNDRVMPRLAILDLRLTDDAMPSPLSLGEGEGPDRLLPRRLLD